jgi:hypothetical protein
MKETTTRVRVAARESVRIAAAPDNVVEGCGRGFNQAATSHLHGGHRDADAKSELRTAADAGPTMNSRAISPPTRVSTVGAYLESRFLERTSLRGLELLGDILSDSLHTRDGRSAQNAVEF